MWLNTFNYIASAASIISLVISLSPYFPSYKGPIRFLTVFFIGTLIGSVFSQASAQTIIFQFEGSFLQIVLLAGAAIAGSIVIVIILAVAIGGEAKESHGAAGGSAAAAFVVLMLFYGLSQFGSGPSYRGRDVDELLALARYYKDQNNRNLALEYYYKALELADRQVKKDMKSAIQRETDALLPK